MLVRCLTSSVVMDAKSGRRPVIKIDVWSDLACPWCYVGKKRLDKAIETFTDVATFDLSLGEGYLDYNRRRWGSDGWTHSLRASGRKDGAQFSDWQWWPNTLKAHQLAQLAEEQGRGSEAHEALFRATYERGQNISNLGVLVQIGRELQLPEVEDFLRESRGEAAVKANDRQAKQKGIKGVPFFVVRSPEESKSYIVEGADTVDSFVRAINMALSPQNAAPPAPQQPLEREGGACST